MSDELCISCRFWGQVRPEGVGVPGIPGHPAQGECKRYAPHPSVGSGHRHVLWPLTAASDYCGEWSARPAAMSARALGFEDAHGVQ